MAQSNVLPVAGWLYWLKSQVLGRWNSSETALKKHTSSTRRWTKGRLPPNSPLHVLCLHSSHQHFMLADLWSWLRFMAGKQSMEGLEDSISSCPWAKSCPDQRALSQVLGCRELMGSSCCDPFQQELGVLLPKPCWVTWSAPQQEDASLQGLQCFSHSLTCNDPWSLIGKVCGFVEAFYFLLLLSFESVVKQEKGKGLQGRGELA